MGWFDEGLNANRGGGPGLGWMPRPEPRDPLLARIEEAEAAQKSQQYKAAQMAAIAEEQRAAQAALAERGARVGIGVPSVPGVPGGASTPGPASASTMNVGEMRPWEPSRPPPVDQTEAFINFLNKEREQAPKFTEGQMTVQRDKQGNILGASNRLDPSGMPVLASSNPNAGPAEVFQGGNVSNPGGQGEESYRNYLRNSGGGRLAQYMAEEASIAKNTALANNPFAAEDQQYMRAAQQNELGMERDAAKQEARYAPYDAATQEKLQSDLNRLASIPDGTPTAKGPMTPQLRKMMADNFTRESLEAKQEIRARAFRAPAATEASY